MNNQKGGSIVIGYLDLLLLSSILSVAIFGNQISKEESVKRRISSDTNIDNKGNTNKFFSELGKELGKGMVELGKNTGNITGEGVKYALGKTFDANQAVISRTGNYIKGKIDNKIEQDRIDKTNVLKITDYFLNDDNKD